MTRVPLDPDALELSFQTAGGPGGQHVNKVATAVRLRFDLASARGLSPGLRVRAARLAGRRLSEDGSIVILAARHRSQADNRRDAIARLQALLDAAASPPRQRIATRPGQAAKARRLDWKQRRGRVKAGRKRPPADG
jgi:ribosome-associated protein